MPKGRRDEDRERIIMTLWAVPNHMRQRVKARLFRELRQRRRDVWKV